MKRELLIDRLEERDFNENFKRKHLNHDKLTQKDLEEISKLFEIGKNTTARICCDEYHGHSYSCLWYYSPKAGVVERLIQEIKAYQEVLKGINEKIKDI